MENYKYVFELPHYQPAFVTILAVVVGYIFPIYVFFRLVDKCIVKQMTIKRAVALNVMVILVSTYAAMIALAYDKSSWTDPKHDKLVATLIEGSDYKSIVNLNNTTFLYCGRYVLDDGSSLEAVLCFSPNNLSNSQKPVEKIVLYKVHSDMYSGVRWHP